MKRILLLGILMMMFFNFGNAKTPKIKKTRAERKLERQEKRDDNKYKKQMKKFQLEAVIKTTKGDISLFLYPEAAPQNVANFVFLAKNNFYNGLAFHRVITNVLVQAGDPVGDGTGNTGYLINDEIVDWLSFDNAGKLALANTGPNTNSSQFFITVSPLTQLNNKYTIIGEIKSREDLSVLRLVRQGDKVTDIEIKGKNVDEFLNYFSSETAQWESILKQNK